MFITSVPGSSGAADVEIGVSEVTGGTEGAVLFVGAGSLLEQDARFHFDSNASGLGYGWLYLDGFFPELRSELDADGGFAVFVIGPNNIPNGYGLIIDDFLGEAFLGSDDPVDLNITSNAVTTWIFQSAGHIVPGANNSYDLGSAAIRVRNGYFGTSVNTPLVETTGATVLTVGTAGAAALFFKAGGTSRWDIDSNGHFLAVADNTYDIGATGDTRPRNIYARTGFVAESGSGAKQTLTSDGITATNNGVTIQASAANALTLLANGGAQGWRIYSAGGVLQALSDNAYDIGFTSTGRPRTGYFGTSVVAPSVLSNGGSDLTLRADSGEILVSSSRLEECQGADVASANDLTLGGDGNAFLITGATTINRIDNTGWQDGAIITLIFDEGLTVTHGSPSAGSDITIILAGSANFNVGGGDVLRLMLFTRSGTQAWYEIGRSEA